LPGRPAVQHGPPDARYVKHSSIRATRVHPRDDRREPPFRLGKDFFPSGRVDFSRLAPHREPPSQRRSGAECRCSRREQASFGGAESDCRAAFGDTPGGEAEPCVSAFPGRAWERAMSLFAPRTSVFSRSEKRRLRSEKRRLPSEERRLPGDGHLTSASTTGRTAVSHQYQTRPMGTATVRVA